MYGSNTLVLFFCMHRSGSSFTTNVFQRLGMSLGPFPLLGARRGNPRGHFEAIPIFELAQQVQTQAHGFPDIFPDSQTALHEFLARDGTWPADAQVSDSAFDCGRTLMRQLLESGPIAGFKDPRLPLVWPFWRKVIAEFSGLRVVPLFLIRSPHEIAMSIFCRDFRPYQDALNVTAVHLSRMFAIRESWSGPKATVRFHPQFMADDLRDAAALCGLTWQDDVLDAVYDPACRHHDSAVIGHLAQDLHDRMANAENAPMPPDNASRLHQDAERREGIALQKANELQSQITALQAQDDHHQWELNQTREQLGHVNSQLDDANSQRMLLHDRLTIAADQLAAAVARIRRFETHPLIRLGLKIRRKVRRCS